MSSAVIVALPESDEKVYRISSEKVPHLTLLYLGDAVGQDDILPIVQHVEHTSSLLNPFGLTVDYRGTLGDEQADVLYFDKSSWDLEAVTEFRHQLLLNDTIRRVYDSVQEYPQWTPHLTLGYPQTPAREDADEYPGIRHVHFDRVAVWTGDFEGPEFRLKYDRSGLEVAMSNNLENFLAHYGVKGMKWGVRRTRKQIDAASEDAEKAETIRSKGKTSGTNALSNAELRTAIERMNLERQYSSLVRETTPKSRGRKFAEALIGDTIETEVRRVAKGAVALKVEKELASRGQEDLASRIKPKKK